MRAGTRHGGERDLSGRRGANKEIWTFFETRRKEAQRQREHKHLRDVKGGTVQ